MIDDSTLHRMAEALVEVPGVRAVVLGGSRARGTYTETSDFDLGVYYDRDRLDVDALAGLAEAISPGAELAGPGGWGPWVDGGAWLTVADTAVDWVLRDIRRVREQCARAVRGEFAFHAQPGHPLGFLDLSYAGEVATCRPLADPEGLIPDLRAGLAPYPEALRRSLVDNLWHARFLLDIAGKGAARCDVAYVAACCSTAAMIAGHAWHAAAGRWVLNEKDLVPGVARLPLDTGGFTDLVHRALASLGETESDLRVAIAHTRQAVDETLRRLGWTGPVADPE